MYAWARNAPPTKLPKGTFPSSSLSLFIRQPCAIVVGHQYNDVETIKALFFSDVGFKVGGNSRITYFVLQIHYGGVSSFRGKHLLIHTPAYRVSHRIASGLGVIELIK